MNSLTRTEFHAWNPKACVRIHGEDAATFLQGQFTNDLQKMGNGGTSYGLWLNQKGKVVADSFITQIAEKDFRVVSYFSPGSVIRERLEAYVIADDVIIEDLTDEHAAVTVFQVPDDAVAMGGGSWNFPGRRGHGSQSEIIFPRSSRDEIRAKLATSGELFESELERRRIRAGIPAVPADIGPTDLPNEGGLEVDAISYTKGCYLGQEVMARLKSMGQVRRRLRQVRGVGDLVSPSTHLFQKGRKVGEVRSAVADGESWIGLAMISSMQFSPTEGLALALDGPASVTVEKIP